MSKTKVLIFVVSFNAEAFIEKVLDRIPRGVWDNDIYDTELLVIDDQSSDKTFDRVVVYKDSHPDLKITILYNPVNQGYGGNQKLGYHYAIDQGFDVVVLLHGDGQYAPENLHQMISPIVKDEADVVLGSRMVNRLDALRGGMPLYKWVGNQVLTYLQNKILRQNLTEFHTGYRAYSVKALSGIPFEFNSNYFDFDTDILIQMFDTKQRIKEIAIPTYYGDEISYVNGWYYALLILLTTTRSRIVKASLFFDNRFNYSSDNALHYTLKLGYPSSHLFALNYVKEGMTVLDLGSGPGYMAKALYEKGAQVISLDRHITQMTNNFSFHAINIELEDFDFNTLNQNIDLVFMLDIIEHLRDPESVLLRLRHQFAKNKPPIILITTGNVAFFPVRFGLMLGQFNYGKKGILDRDHRRLFTFKSMKRLLNSTGFETLKIQGIPAPFPEAIGTNLFSRLFLKVNSFLILIWRGLFSYQIACTVRPRPMVEHLLEHAHIASLQKINTIDPYR